MKKLFWLSVLAFLALFDRVVPEFIEDVFYGTQSQLRINKKAIT